MGLDFVKCLFQFNLIDEIIHLYELLLWCLNRTLEGFVVLIM